MKEHSLYQDGWKWVEVDFSDEEKVKELTKDYPLNEKWLKKVESESENTLEMEAIYKENKEVWESLVYSQDPEARNKQEFFLSILPKFFC